MVINEDVVTTENLGELEGGCRDDFLLRHNYKYREVAGCLSSCTVRQ